MYKHTPFLKEAFAAVRARNKEAFRSASEKVKRRTQKSTVLRQLRRLAEQIKKPVREYPPGTTTDHIRRAIRRQGIRV